MKENVRKFGITIKKCYKFKDKFFGLAFKKNIRYGIFLNNCNAIHTFFMREKIDVIFLDVNEEIISVYYNVLPKKILYEKGAKHVIELKCGCFNEYIKNRLRV